MAFLLGNHPQGPPHRRMGTGSALEYKFSLIKNTGDPVLYHPASSREKTALGADHHYPGHFLWISTRTALGDHRDIVIDDDQAMCYL